MTDARGDAPPVPRGIVTVLAIRTADQRWLRRAFYVDAPDIVAEAESPWEAIELVEAEWQRRNRDSAPWEATVMDGSDL